MSSSSGWETISQSEDLKDSFHELLRPGDASAPISTTEYNINTLFDLNHFYITRNLKPAAIHTALGSEIQPGKQKQTVFDILNIDGDLFFHFVQVNDMQFKMCNPEGRLIADYKYKSRGSIDAIAISVCGESIGYAAIKKNSQSCLKSNYKLQIVNRLKEKVMWISDWNRDTVECALKTKKDKVHGIGGKLFISTRESPKYKAPVRDYTLTFYRQTSAEVKALAIGAAFLVDHKISKKKIV